MSLFVDTPIQYLKGVGPKLGENLKKRDIHTVGDRGEQGLIEREFLDECAERGANTDRAEHDEPPGKGARVRRD